MMISYAQNFEDVMLWRALKHIEHGFYIDVGAAWPVQDSVTKYFYDKGWRGINIEPNPELFQLLQQERLRDINLQVALGNSTGKAKFQIIANPGLSTLVKDIAKKHESDLGYGLHEVEVDVVTLQAVCSQYVPSGSEIMFLKIDVEGFEKEAIEGNDWQRYRPWIILVESTKPMSQEETYNHWEYILLDNNYLHVYSDGLNRFYVASEHGELISSFKYPPNVFDNFTLSQTVILQQRIAELETELRGIYNSKSWKLTAPLRRIKQWLR
jgi:FkbM family methyltransferase